MMNVLIIDHPRQPVPAPDESAHGAILLGLGVVAAFFVGLGGWAAYAPLNGAAIAPAVIKVEGNRKTIQHLDGGIVKELPVKDGARVEAGQTLIVLDETQARAARDVLAQQFDVLRGEEARLLAERDGDAAIVFPGDLLARHQVPEVRRILETEVRQFDIRRTALEGQISVLNQRIEELQEQIRGAEAQRRAVNEQPFADRRRAQGPITSCSKKG